MERVQGSGRTGVGESDSVRVHARVGKWERAAGVGEDDSAGEEGKGEGMWQREREAKASTEGEDTRETVRETMRETV